MIGSSVLAHLLNLELLLDMVVTGAHFHCEARTSLKYKNTKVRTVPIEYWANSLPRKLYEPVHEISVSFC